jgi:hypothetical protein
MRMRTMTEKLGTSRVNARVALAAYMATEGQDTDEAAALGDLIADLAHLADDVGERGSDVLRLATEHYEYESDPSHADEQV